MAQRLLEALPELLEAECQAAYLRGFQDGQQVQEPGSTNRLECLRSLLADSVKRAKVRKVLRLSDVLLDRVAAGTVGLSKTNWAKLQKALGNPNL